MKPYLSSKKKLDNVGLGAVFGLITPIITLYGFYLFKYNYLSFSDFYSKILLANNILLPSISLCVIANLLIFFIFIWTDRNYSARGVLLATMVYAGYVISKKYL